MISVCARTPLSLLHNAWAAAILLCLLSTALFASSEEKLRAPLTTNVYAQGKISATAQAIQAQIQVPENAPADLGVGAFIKDDDGNWFQLAHPGVLKPGHHHLHFPLDRDSHWQSEPQTRIWDPYQQFLAHEFGLYFWSASNSDTIIKVYDIRSVLSSPSPPSQDYTLYQLNWDAHNPEDYTVALQTGQRWEIRCRLDPMPSNPYDDSICSLELIINTPDNKVLKFPGFYKQDMDFVDRGSHEQGIPKGPGMFAARFRPMQAGTYQAKLVASWHNPNGDPIQKEFKAPSLIVSGETWDPYARADQTDPRFFSYGPKEKQFIWPIGVNIRSITDPRGSKRTKSQATPDRGMHAYRAYIDRYAKAGATNVEIWMSSWNLALEWLNDWPGFHGVGAYHEANAARIDELLDYAWERGMRVILVINNHGQASTKADAEWKNSPYNKQNGGPIYQAGQMFSDETSMMYQQRHRRYVVGRYADHPAILCWKLWTEQNLTQGSRSNLIKWHKQAFDDFHKLDHYYRHPCTTHWSGDYNVPDRNLVKMPEMDAIAIDAYHRGKFLPQLLYNSTYHEHRGLAQYNKPLIVTEFGGNWDACPIPQLRAEHASGFWVALMSGHASSPHLWWFEWVDQEQEFWPYRAMNNFVTGEDLRNPKARSVKLDIRNKDNKNAGSIIWSRAWAMPGSILGYCIDYQWGDKGTSHPLHQGFSILISKNAKPGHIQLEWWDANLGTCIQQKVIEHPGGALRLAMPDFRRHIAFKLKRLDVQAVTEEEL